MSNLADRSAAHVNGLLQSREVSAAEVVEAAITRIEAVDGVINALPIRDFERAREAAAGFDALPQKVRSQGVLHGLPVVIKDQHDVTGLPTTQGFKPFAHAQATRDDVLVQRLRRRGAIIIAKSNVPELAFGGGCTNPVFGSTRNPWHLSRTAGGSSGGAAAALAAREAWLATGSDLGGSLRMPAAFCGVVGFRPSPGVVPFGPRTLPFDLLSVCGPMARSVGDVALLFDAMAGRDPSDPLSRDLVGSARRAAAAAPPLDRLRVAWSPDLGGICIVEPTVLAGCQGALKALEAAGLDVRPVSPDLVDGKIAVNILRGARLASLGPLLTEHGQALPNHVRHEIERGLALGADDIARAEAIRARLYYGFAALMDDFDVLICPTTITPAFGVELIEPASVAGVSFEAYSDWFLLTHVLSLLGCPAISLPCGLDPDGLPIGLQLVGRPGEDLALLAVASAVEAVLAWPAAWPGAQGDIS
ncbi:amidase [Phenylobacterium sp.]|uniref:amidase n=1 Tax=Phenylobacterium sp. TaxID=1871053 RepID=UPI002FC7C829